MSPSHFPFPEGTDCASGLVSDEICRVFHLSPAFRGKQVFKALQQGVSAWTQISTLSLNDRNRLSEEAPLFSSMPVRFDEASDGSAKLLLQLIDGRFVESVLLVDENGRKTACLSSQVGCAMGCAFCRTGTMGLLRNLSTGEILEQYYHLKNHYGEISNIVFMGMGEPLANLPRVQKAIAILNHPEGPGIGIRKITVSTCGIIDGIRSLSETALIPRLACSLVTADPKLRQRLMPISKANPLPELKQALQFYQEKSKRRITLECVLLGGINSAEEQAQGVAEFAKGLSVLVNVIPWNPTEGLDFRPPSDQEIIRYRKRLEQAGIAVSRRYRRGSEINGACGQLAVLENRPDSSDPCR